MSDLSCAQADELTAAVAAGGADAETRRDFLRHLRECSQPHAETRELIAAANALPPAVVPVTPRPALRERLMATIANTPQQAIAPPAARGNVHADPSARDWFGWLRPGVARGLALVAVPLVLVLVVFAFRLQSDLSARDATLQQLAQALSRGDEVFAAKGSAGAGYVVRGDDRASLIVADLAPAPSGHVYEMWLIDAAGHAAAAGTFSVEGEVSVAQLDTTIGQATMFAVTLEQRRVEQPTSDPILVADLTQ
jgi:preprotein translocase subunit YajC